MPFASLRLLGHRYLAPVLAVVRHYLPWNARQVRLVALLGVAASVMNVAGYVLLLPLIESVTRNQAAIRMGPLSIESVPETFLAIVSVVVILLVAALWLNYRVHLTALDVHKRTAIRAAVEGLQKIRNQRSMLDRQARSRLLRAVRMVAMQIAFGCGFTMKQVALGVADLLQLVVFLAVMFWLSPWLTLALLAVTLIAGSFYARSVHAVAESVCATRDLSMEAGAEFRDLARAMAAGKLDEDGLGLRLKKMYEDGSPGALLTSRLDMHREFRRGPMLIELVYPVALIVLPVVALTTDSLGSLAGRLIVYVLMLRQAIGLMQGLAALFIMINRFHPQLVCHADLMAGTTMPQCLFTAEDEPDGMNQARVHEPG